MKTTLNEIRGHNPCADGWEKLLKYLGKTKADDEPLPITTIIDSNGLQDALWCLRAVDGYDREIRLYAVWCVRQVQHLLTDKRSLDALDTAEIYANGDATVEELNSARSAAKAARAAAMPAAVWWAVEAAMAAAMPAAVWCAAEAAAYAAVWCAAEAARAAAAAVAASRAAARSAANAAARAAMEEMGTKQEAGLRRICEEVGG